MELQLIQSKITEIRGYKVMLDRDLAVLYGVETKVLNQAVKRNIARFEGEDFMFQLTKKEIDNYLRSQFVTLNDETSRSQFVTLNKGRGSNIKYAPFAFTELGVAMLSSVLNSDTAIEANRNIMRAFVMVRQFALNYKELADKLQEMEEKYNRQFANVNEAINYLLQKDKIEIEQKNRRRIGYTIK